MLVVLVLSFIIGGVAIAADTESTIVGPVMENRYVAPAPQDKDVAPPEQVQKLMDQGVIPAAEQARLEQQVLQNPVKK
jgi:hypothetical protein